MLAEEKLKEAEYWLETLKKTDPNRKEFRYHLGAFLSAIRSIMDYLLEDYNRKFSLGFSLDEKLYPNEFEKKAKQLGHKDALNFIRWWKKKLDDLKKDRTVGPLITKRHVYIHRQPVPLSAEIEVTNIVTTRAEIFVHDKDGRIKAHNKSEDDTEQNYKNSNKVNVEWFFDKDGKMPVIPVCEKCLNIMKNVIDETKQKFD